MRNIDRGCQYPSSSLIKSQKKSCIGRESNPGRPRTAFQMIGRRAFYHWTTDASVSKAASQHSYPLLVGWIKLACIMSIHFFVVSGIPKVAVEHHWASDTVSTWWQWKAFHSKTKKWNTLSSNKIVSHAGNRTPAAAVKAPNPNH